MPISWMLLIVNKYRHKVLCLLVLLAVLVNGSYRIDMPLADGGLSITEVCLDPCNCVPGPHYTVETVGDMAIIRANPEKTHRMVFISNDERVDVMVPGQYLWLLADRWLENDVGGDLNCDGIVNLIDYAIMSRSR